MYSLLAAAAFEDAVAFWPLLSMARKRKRVALVTKSAGKSPGQHPNSPPTIQYDTRRSRQLTQGEAHSTATLTYIAFIATAATARIPLARSIMLTAMAVASHFDLSAGRNGSPRES